MKNNILNIFLLCLSLFSTGCKNSSSSPSTSESSMIVENKNYWSSSYANPLTVTNASGINYNSEVADPSIVRGDDGYFYLVSTNQVFLRSENACSWELITDRIIEIPLWGKEYDKTGKGYGVWAPDLIKINNKWIYYYSLSGYENPIGIGYATSDDIAGPYVDQGKLFTCDEIGIANCIDPQPFIDDDGTVYLTVGSFQGLYLIELTDDGTECFNGIEYQNENKILIAGKVGQWDESTYEGGYIVKRGDYYYYFGSVGTCCVNQSSTYRVFVGRSDTVSGPYKDKSKMPLTMSGSGKTYGELVIWSGVGADRDVVAPGHNSILKDDAGDYWIYYHAYSCLDRYATRHLFMDKIEWDEDGFPYVEGKKPTFEEEIDGPRFEVVE